MIKEGNYFHLDMTHNLTSLKRYHIGKVDRLSSDEKGKFYNS